MKYWSRFLTQESSSTSTPQVQEQETLLIMIKAILSNEEPPTAASLLNLTSAPIPEEAPQQEPPVADSEMLAGVLPDPSDVVMKVQPSFAP